jgi:beta-aspartyl-peptidase (threonine type)
MSDRSTNSVVLVTGLIFILLLVVGGVGVYYVIGRQQMALAVAAEQARAAEAAARMEAQKARDEAARAVAARTELRDGKNSQADGDSVRAAVESVLRAQEDAWNRGDLDAFMDHYWKSDDLTISSGGQTRRGWQATLDLYRERYPTPETMGRLSLSGLEITPLGDAAALVVGQWKVDREIEPVSGHFSLVMRKFDHRWVIVHDHTSRRLE